MPHERYIKKMDLNELQLNGIQEQDENTEEWKAYHKMQNAATTLQDDTKTRFLNGKRKKDSPLMDAVKKATRAITQFYTEKTISDDKEDFERQLKQLRDLYGTLKESCKVYLAQRGKHKGWKFFGIGEGHRRRRLVEKTLARATAEMNLLENRAKQVFDEYAVAMDEENRPLWINVLAETRTRYLDFRERDDNIQIEHTGGNTSTVLKMTDHRKGEVSYIKEEEMNIPASRMVEKYISEYLNSDFVKGLEREGTDKKAIEDFLNYLHFNFQYNQTIRANFITTNDFHAEDFLDKEKMKNFKPMVIKAANNKLLILPDEIREFLDNKHVEDIAGEFGAFFYRCNLTQGIATHMARIAPDANITVRNVAMYRLAELLGVSDVIPTTSRVMYTDEAGKEHHGILMAEAKGRSFYEENQEISAQIGENSNRALINKTPIVVNKYDAKTCLQLNSLQVLDILAAQVDRHLGNIVVEKDGNRIVQAKGIDNDMCFGTLTYQMLNKCNEEKENCISSNIRPLEENNSFLLKVLDRRLYENLLSLDDDIVTYVFTDLLSKDEIKCLKNRIHGVQKVFRKIKNDKDVKICMPDELTERDNAQMKLQEQSLAGVIPINVNLFKVSLEAQKLIAKAYLRNADALAMEPK